MCAYAWNMETTLDGEQVLSDEGYSAFDEERWAPEPPKSKSRTAFERDRARLIHSSALRRLGAKSQILIAGTDDFARTRLTHTLEVAQIGRQIGALLGCDPDVVDCACLAHDLGHPPFGHNGERALADIASNIGGFEGNAQTMRILTRLEPKIFHPDGRSAGVNLTRAALDAAVKYPWTLAEAAAHPKGERSAKFCVYPDDTDVFAWLKQHAPDTTRRPVECQVMDLSDDIAYSVHDVEDAIATAAVIALVLGAGKPVLAIFNNDPQVIEIGYSRLLILFGSYIFSLTYEILSGYLRGFGISLVPAILTLFGVCGVRIIWINTVFPLHHTFRSIMLVYPISLATTAVLIFIALLIYRPSRRFAARSGEQTQA